MKKLLAMMLAAMMVLSLAACGNNTGGKVQEPTNPPVNNEQETESSEVTPDGREVNIIETVLFDQYGLKIKAVSLDVDGPAGPEIELLITNSAEQDTTIESCDIDINGRLTKASFSHTVGAGKEDTMHIAIDQAELDAHEIETITLIGFTFHIIPAGEEGRVDIPRVQIPTSATQPEDFEVEIETPAATDEAAEDEGENETAVEDESATEEDISN